MIGIPEFAILIFAGYRVTRLVVHDSILDPVRDRLYAWHEAAPNAAARSAVIALIACTFCVGWWLSGAVLATWLLTTGLWSEAPVLVHGVEWLAVAGGQALLSRWDDTRPTGEAG